MDLEWAHVTPAFDGRVVCDRTRIDFIHPDLGNIHFSRARRYSVKAPTKVDACSLISPEPLQAEPSALYGGILTK
jgi:hypothetical protein